MSDSYRNTGYGYLYDVAIIRIILVILLVLYHAFAPFSGAWTPIEGYPDIRSYWWFDKFSYAFMLETFVFVSGYVYGYQVKTKGESRLEFKSLFLSKFKRLMIPSIIFSLLYILLLQDINQPVVKTLYEVVCGVAHMWFLPMLFWCFIAVWLIEKSHVPSQVAVLVIIAMSLLPIPSLPCQIHHVFYYLPFFYAGYMLQRRDISLKSLYKPNVVVMLTIAFIALFPTLTLSKEWAEGLMGGVISVW